MNRTCFRLLLLAGLLLIRFSGYSQLNPDLVIPQLKQHIQTLASDKFEGRETGEKGEKASYEYITGIFSKIGIIPKGTDGYLQAFPFTKKTTIGPSANMVINGKQLKPVRDFFPLAYSSNGSVKGKTVFVGFGIIDNKQNYNDYKDLKDLKGKIFLMEYSTPDHAGPHTKYGDMGDIRTRLDTAIAKGATGVIFVNSDKEVDDPKQEYKNRITPCTIPVAFITSTERDSFLSLPNKMVEMKMDLIKDEGTGHNIIGYINNNAKSTVVIGAHYDHLGYGGDESLYRGEPAIHNGADDNASGTAALIEMARYLKEKGPKGNNYLLMAYSGEEKGLLGSGYWIKNPTIPLESINYMLNMDMVGRLKTEDPTLLVNGVGTSEAWKLTMDFIKIDSLKIKTTESGVGPSDHTSFYLKNIPVLHFFSGTHSDYHKPSDDEPLINYQGELRIMDYMVQLISKLDDKGKLTFIKTKDDNNEDAPRFKVTLGVIPDYAFDGEGMRIDGITDGRPASKAGFESGDIVIQMGEIKVVDMMSYMKALGKFNKGDKTMVTVLRGKDKVTSEVEF